MANCKSTKYAGRVVVLEYQIVCGDTLPAANAWKRFAAMRAKEFNLEWETIDATADDSVGALRENLASFQTLTMSGDGTAKASGAGAANLIELTKHVANPEATAGQPVAWLRMTFPDLTFTAFMIITSMSRSAPYDDVVTFSMEASATASDFGLIVEDTPDPNAAAVASVSVAPAAMNLQIGKTAKIVANVLPSDALQGVTWESETPATATVNALTGVVTGVAAGEVVITAKSASDAAKTATCTVTVTA